MEPRWLSRLVIDAIHHDTIFTHGGMPGTRDEGLLESALARPRQLFAYGGVRDTPTLAAGYAFGLASNHPYRDGNKRVAFIAMAVFSELNGLELVADDSEAVETMLRLAAGALEEEQLVRWLRERLAEPTD